MQFAEGLSDRQAAEAVRARIDWKYVLGLELSDPGFDYSALSEFRNCLLSGSKVEKVIKRWQEDRIRRHLAGVKREPPRSAE